MKERLATIQTRVATLRALQTQDLASANRAKDDIDALTEKLAVYANAILLCQRVMESKADLKKFIENIVTAMLQAVVDPGLEFLLEPVRDEEQGTLTGYKPMYRENGMLMTPKQQGGGCRSVTTLAIRMCFNAFLSRRLKLMPFMFMDEQLMHLDVEKWPKLMEFMRSMGESITLQTLWITHGPGEFPRMITLTRTGKTITRVTQEGETL